MIEIQVSGGTKTTVTHTASSWASFDTDDKANIVTIFGTPYYLNTASVQAGWDEGENIPKNPTLTVSYFSVLGNGKCGNKYQQREFQQSDIGKYIVGQESVLTGLFEAFFTKANEVVLEKAVA